MTHVPANAVFEPVASPDDLRAIAHLEALRCAMISNGDMDGLRTLLTADYIHIHAMGRADAVDDAVGSFRGSPRICWRVDPYIRVFGEIGIVTGLQENIFGSGHDVRHVNMQVTTIVRRMSNGWKFVSFHGCTIA